MYWETRLILLENWNVKLVKKVVLVYIKVNKKVKITDISTNRFDVSSSDCII